MGSWTDAHAVLNISRDFQPEELKRAYRRALLQYHPDKVGTDGAQTVPVYSIDDVNRAYSMLRQGDDDSELPELNTVVNFNEVCDLATFEEFDQGDGSSEWVRDCRCGEQGYKLTEEDLIKNGDADEIAVQCAGCSLWILVQYAVE